MPSHLNHSPGKNFCGPEKEGQTNTMFVTETTCIHCLDNFHAFVAKIAARQKAALSDVLPDPTISISPTPPGVSALMFDDVMQDARELVVSIQVNPIELVIRRRMEKGNGGKPLEPHQIVLARISSKCIIDALLTNVAMMMERGILKQPLMEMIDVKDG